jgi:alpha-ketoglutarate-dependent taurine dioxygenase
MNTDMGLNAIATSEAVSRLAWNAADMWTKQSWRFSASDALIAEAHELVDWASTRVDPILEMTCDGVATPFVDDLAQRIQRELTKGSGVAWVEGFAALSEQALRLLYLKMGLAIGNPLDVYGRLYDVRDTGVSHQNAPVPVSLTREATGIHTDSSAKNVLPRWISLACVRQAQEGGTSRLVSAAWVHEQLRAKSPDLLALLYNDFIRDIVTPGGQRDVEKVAANRFPIFSNMSGLCFRYMRFWIERGHTRCDEALDADTRAALDALDAALTAPEAALSFRMQPGDMLWIDNTTLAHDRDAYRDAPDGGRLMVRMWLAEKNGAP